MDMRLVVLLLIGGFTCASPSAKADRVTGDGPARIFQDALARRDTDRLAELIRKEPWLAPRVLSALRRSGWSRAEQLPVWRAVLRYADFLAPHDYDTVETYAMREEIQQNFIEEFPPLIGNRFYWRDACGQGREALIAWIDANTPDERSKRTGRPISALGAEEGFTPITYKAEERRKEALRRYTAWSAAGIGVAAAALCGFGIYRHRRRGTLQRG